MSWLLTSLVGKPDVERREESIPDGPRESGVAEDLSQLRDTFTRQLRGFSSFLAGEDELPEAKARQDRTASVAEKGNTPAEEPADTNTPGFPVDAGEILVKARNGEQGGPVPGGTVEPANHLSLEAYPVETQEYALERPLAAQDGSNSEAAEEAIPLTPRLDTNRESAGERVADSAAFGFDQGSRPKLSVSGMRNDLAELSGTFRNHFSRFSSVVRAVTGEDVQTGQKGSSGQQKEFQSMGEDFSRHESQTESLEGVPKNEHHVSQRGLPFLGLGYAPSAGSGGEIELFQEDEEERDDGKNGKNREEAGEDDSENESLLRAAREDIDAIRDSLASGISGISKFASQLMPFNVDDGSDGSDGEGWEGANEFEAVAVNDQVITLADSIAARPETWIDFPLPDDDNDEDFMLTEAQEQHLEAVEYAAPRLAALRLELTPEHMSEARFWKIYFVLLHSKLTPEEAAILVTPQIVEARNTVLDTLQRRAGGEEVAHSEASPEQWADGGQALNPRAQDRSEATLVPVGTEQLLPAFVDEIPLQAAGPGKAMAGRSAEANSKGNEGMEGVVQGTHASVMVAERESEERSDKPLVSPSGGKESGKGVEEVETEADDWLEDEEAAATPRDGGGNEEEVSFSDLEDEEEAEGGKHAGEAEAGGYGHAAVKAGNPELEQRKRSEEAREWLEVRDRPGVEDNSGTDQRASSGQGQVHKGELKGKHEEDGSPCGSDRTESADWQTIDEDDVLP